ncbi:hypothetical protein LINGRAHAP2_LOCUS30089 [Linum grandiflorum]
MLSIPYTDWVYPAPYFSKSLRFGYFRLVRWKFTSPDCGSDAVQKPLNSLPHDPPKPGFGAFSRDSAEVAPKWMMEMSELYPVFVFIQYLDCM